MILDLVEHEPLVRSLMYQWGVPSEDADDMFQEFVVYYYTYFKDNYDPNKSIASTFLTLNFKYFMLKQTQKKKDIMKDVIRIESRDPEFADRALGVYEDRILEQIIINDLLQDASQDTIDLLIGDKTYHDLAERDGITFQGANLRFQKEIKKIRKK